MGWSSLPSRGRWEVVRNKNAARRECNGRRRLITSVTQPASSQPPQFPAEPQFPVEPHVLEDSQLLVSAVQSQAVVAQSLSQSEHSQMQLAQMQNPSTQMQSTQIPSLQTQTQQSDISTVATSAAAADSVVLPWLKAKAEATQRDATRQPKITLLSMSIHPVLSGKTNNSNLLDRQESISPDGKGCLALVMARWMLPSRTF